MITIKNQAAVTRPLNHNLFLNLNHFLVVADSRRFKQKTHSRDSRGFLLNGLRSTSANGVANYNDDRQFNRL
jgi:hypothetical protein